MKDHIERLYAIADLTKGQANTLQLADALAASIESTIDALRELSGQVGELKKAAAKPAAKKARA